MRYRRKWLGLAVVAIVLLLLWKMKSQGSGFRLPGLNSNLYPSAASARARNKKALDRNPQKLFVTDNMPRMIVSFGDGLSAYAEFDCKDTGEVPYDKYSLYGDTQPPQPGNQTPTTGKKQTPNRAHRHHKRYKYSSSYHNYHRKHRNGNRHRNQTSDGDLIKFNPFSALKRRWWGAVIPPEEGKPLDRGLPPESWESVTPGSAEGSSKKPYHILKDNRHRHSRLNSTVQSSLWTSLRGDNLFNDPNRPCSPITWPQVLCYDLLLCVKMVTLESQYFVGVDHVNAHWQSIQPGFHHELANDFVTQADEWVQFAREARNEAMSKPGKNLKWEFDNKTLFTVWFGLGDVMKYALMERGKGIQGVRKSLDMLFAHMKRLQDSVRGSRFLVPYVLDITLFPGFEKTVIHPSGKTLLNGDLSGKIHRNAAFLVRFWNQELEMRAKSWKSNIFLWDVNSWLAAEIRLGTSWTGSSGVGGYGDELVREPVNGMVPGGFKEVLKPCVTKVNGVWEICENPDDHLMWDDMHLSAKANQKLAKGALSIVTENWFRSGMLKNPPTWLDREMLLAGGGLTPKEIEDLDKDNRL